MKYLKIVFCSFVLLYLCSTGFCFCPPGGGSPDLNTIAGVLKDFKGRPLSKVKVRIKDTYIFYITDENGFFILINVDLENPVIEFEQRIRSKTGTQVNKADIALGDIGMKKVVFLEAVLNPNGTAEIKHIKSKESYDLKDMTPEEFATFQFEGASLENQVKAFLGVKE